MATGNELQNRFNHPIPLVKFVLIGAAIGLMLISLFLFTAGDADPNWPKLWRLRPLIIVPLAGAMGGVFYYFMDYLGSHGKINRVVGIVLSLIVFIIGLWLGIVLGLDGTYWD
ncbi:MAG TPA: hypothetical protein VD794_14880 [Flavisolibacter sp.]|nr:hypothetical protein [Flavisolibacter sp.]